MRIYLYETVKTLIVITLADTRYYLHSIKIFYIFAGRLFSKEQVLGSLSIFGSVHEFDMLDPIWN